MVFIAFIMRAWICMINDMGGNARVLADDLLVFASGVDHEAVFKKVYDATRGYLADIGAQVAHTKSHTLSMARPRERG